MSKKKKMLSATKSLTRPSWAGVGRLEAYRHKHTVDKKGRPKIIFNYYDNTKGLE
jgi:hypothetical protein